MDEELRDEKQAHGISERAVELWAEAPAADAETRFKRSRVLALLAGPGGEAKSGVTKAEAAAFAARSSLPSATPSAPV
jgi:hypothetical protein